MKRIACSIFIALAVFLFLACSSAQKGDKKELEDFTASGKMYMPLDIGNKWTYEMNYLGYNGEESIEIVSKKDDWYLDSKGNSITVDKRGIRDKSRYLLMFPLIENKPWISIVSPTVTETRKILNVNETVKVPAGLFESAISVETTMKVDKDKVLRSVTYFVTNVGIVKIDTYLDNLSDSTSVQQTAADLKKFTKTEKKN